MRIVSVAAPGNGSGKTLVLTGILEAFPGRLSAVKFTTVFKDGVNCPRTEKACACRSLHGRYTVITDPEILSVEDSDTGRFVRSGARLVVWCLARVGAHRDAWDHLRRDLVPDDADLITEGNTVIPVISPDLLVFVVSPRVPRERWKPDAEPLIAAADLVIVNTHGTGPAQTRSLADGITRSRGGAAPMIEDVSVPLERWRDGRLRQALARLLDGAQ